MSDDVDDDNEDNDDDVRCPVQEMSDDVDDDDVSQERVRCLCYGMATDVNPLLQGLSIRHVQGCPNFKKQHCNPKVTTFFRTKNIAISKKNNIERKKTKFATFPKLDANVMFPRNSEI